MNRVLRALGASCDETARLLSELADGELRRFRRFRVEAHFAACAGCRALYRGLVGTLETLSALGRVEPEARPQLVEAVRRRIEHGECGRGD